VRSGSEAAIHARARSYDLVLNGVELGGGSVRIHDPELQLASLALVEFLLLFGLCVFFFSKFSPFKVGVSEERARATLGHLLSGLASGAPPHAGLALGLDRLVMLLLRAPALRDVIAFPKAADGKEPLVGSPAHLVDEKF
jgi:aspartyl-tRNA synthetase